ncbi:MAG: hypothetical protein ACSHX8_06945 [Opitutaceae bacterium]
MKPSSYILSGVLVWSASLGLAFYLGQNNQEATQSTANSGKQSDNSRSTASKSHNLNDGDDTLLADGTNSEMEAVAASVLSDYFNGGEVTLADAIANINSLSASQARSFIAEALALPMSDPGRSRMVTALLEQLAQSQPEEAYALTANIGSIRDVERAKAAILEVWAKNDPVKALNWAQTALADESQNTKAAQMRAIFRGYAALNPNAALTAAQSLPAETRGEQRMRQELMAEVIETQVRQGNLEEAKLAIALLEDGSDAKEVLVRELVNEWARYDPQGAASYITSLGDSASTNLKASLVNEWAEHDPSAAAAWLSNLDVEDPTVARAAGSIIDEWARYDLNASAEWLNSLPASGDLDRAVATYTMRAAREDPANAMTWAESIFDDRGRTRMMQNVAYTWKSEDPEGFEEYLSTSGLSTEEQAALQESNGGGFGRGGDRRGGGGGGGGGRGR